jgi:hypothetical protein
VIQPDNSGSLVLQTNNGTTALTIDTSQNITTTNKLSVASMPTGSVLQVVQGSTSTGNTTTSNSFTASSLTASITPSSSANKILISIASLCANTGNGQGNFTIFRNLTNLAGGSQNSFAYTFVSSGYTFSPLTMIYLDSPATTSSTTYTVYFKTNSGATTTYLNDSVTQSTITLMEIKG